MPDGKRHWVASIIGEVTTSPPSGYLAMFFITTPDGRRRARHACGRRARLPYRDGQAMFPEEDRGFDDNGPMLPPQSFHPTGLNRPPAMDRSVIG